ncbi:MULTISPECIES: hypothetical protein [Pectobacterium]|uniref:Uncharacterized protein n=1 Tax=Pectobacterium aquaticum TaxID=2204145 RepID=A0A426JE27_9GAMM|nr:MULTISPECIES: hypothetical protein [Pectobacterium]MBN3238281.1 hypothetical protein [Pectobacterium versatile]MBQ4778171.1 hypothetical protein [Pectobacterium versatile]RRO11418.1 hypothetical protein DMB85_003695 [Pectobacterium aquaticum]
MTDEIEELLAAVISLAEKYKNLQAATQITGEVAGFYASELLDRFETLAMTIPTLMLVKSMIVLFLMVQNLSKGLD